jgi:hypothetical protein
MTVLFALEANKGQNLLRLYAADAADTEGVKAKLQDQQNALKTIGVLSSGGKMDLSTAIDNLLERNRLYRADIEKFAYHIEARTLDNVDGKALHSQAREVGQSVDKARATAAEALRIVPQAGIEGTEAKRPESLVDAIEQMKVHIEAIDKEYKARQKDIADWQAKKQLADEQADAAKAKLQADFDELAKAKDATIASTQQQVTEAQEQSAKLREDYDAALKVHNDFVSETKVEKQELVNEIIEKDQRIRELSVRIARALASEFEPDGKVVSLRPGQNTGYINLGKGQGVFNGLTFSVFDPSELGKAKPNPKGAIRLTNVMANSSEFYIVQRKGSPIVEGDIVTNPAFDIVRQFHFAVVGRFDVNGDGADDIEWIKEKIRDFGGKVQKTVTVQTDYLVAGDDPMSAAPAAGIGPISPTTAVGRDKLREEQEVFGEATDLAARLHIPVLNQNRFLSLIGHPTASVAAR